MVPARQIRHVGAKFATVERMRSTVVFLALAALYASSTLGDNLHFRNIQDPEQIQEVSAVILAISEAPGEITGADFFVGGPPEQVELARWLMNHLDRPQHDEPSVPQMRADASITHLSPFERSRFFREELGSFSRNAGKKQMWLDHLRSPSSRR